MEIYQLRTFLAVARAGHLTRAAEQLHITQPAVSKQVKALEEELGVLLFDRMPSGMALTKAGEVLLPQAERTLFSAMELLNSAKRMQGEVAGAVRLGTIIDPESIKLGSLLGAVLQYYPLLQVKLQHGISGGVLQQLQAGELDAGFYLGHVTEPSIEAMLLQTVVYRVIAPPSWADKMANATWDTLATMPWVGTPAHSSQHRLVRQILHQHGHEPRFVVEADQESSMISLVKSGVGLCLMRDELASAALARGEVYVWDKVEQPCPLMFIYPRAKAQDPMVLGMVRVLREIWGAIPT
jgi:DNA-binding transcriptional LysR family regulator